jgi:hypothetical protein
MGKYVIKAARDKECYAIWSTSVGSVLHIFMTREETLEFLHEEAIFEYSMGTFAPLSRLERADLYGCSAMAPGSFHWDHKYILFGEDSPPREPGFYWMLPRSRFYDYCQLRHIGADEEALQLFERFPEED